MKWERWVDLRFLVLIKEMREEDESNIFLCYPRGSGTTHQYFCKLGGVISVRGVFVSD